MNVFVVPHHSVKCGICLALTDVLLKVPGATVNSGEEEWRATLCFTMKINTANDMCVPQQVSNEMEWREDGCNSPSVLRLVECISSLLLTELPVNS